MKNKIPIDSHDWIDYSSSDCLIIEIDEDGSTGNYQYGGIMCYQGNVTGNVVAEINSDLKWFSSSWWYRLYHTHEGLENRDVEPVEKYTEDEVFKVIIKEINDTTLFNFDISEDNNWNEAQIYIRNNDKLYLITWMNCD